MKLVIEYDPWADLDAAKRAADALTVLGIPAELREVRLTRGLPDAGPVKFEAPMAYDSNGNDAWTKEIDLFASARDYVLVAELLEHLHAPTEEAGARSRVIRVLRQLGYDEVRVRPKYSPVHVRAYAKKGGKK